VLTAVLFVAAGYPGHAFLPHRVFAGGDIMIFPRSISLATTGGGDEIAGTGSGTAPGEPAFIRLERDWISELYSYFPDAFDYGAPPHGGVAPGMDRTAALFAQETDIRETIAFPKTKSATDLMTGAPYPVARDALDAVGLTVKPGLDERS